MSDNAAEFDHVSHGVTPPKPWNLPHLSTRRRRNLRQSAIIAGAAAVGFFSAILLYSMRLSRVIDRELAAGPFSGSIQVFSAPRTLAVGDEATLEGTLRALRRSGYSTGRGNTICWYHVRGDVLEIFPGRDTCDSCEPGTLEFKDGKVARIVSLQDNTERPMYRLSPQLVASLSEDHAMRRTVRFQDIPDSLKSALVSVEDKRFFRHAGFDPLRMIKAAYVDLKDGRKQQGASTLSMQLARGLWLDRDKSWGRKFRELLIALRLEDKLSKEQIFEYYANQVYLGRRGPFSINGFAEGARVFFGRDLTQISAPEAATLAGMVQRPSYFDPYRYPERTEQRRNLVLELMAENGYISQAERERLVSTPLALAPQNSDNLGSQYFLDLVNKELQSKLEDRAGATRYIYTTLDPELQRAAEAAIGAGMTFVEQQLRRKKGGANIPAGEPQAALIALDPRTGEVKALAGGRDYASSQLNRVVALRQPGSAFKPFVYAAALNTALDGDAPQIFTPASLLQDEPTSFFFRRQVYSPSNFGHDFMGDVTLRTALKHSLNVATVQLAQEVGFQNVAALAHRMGLNEDIQPTPSMALGAYETTPLEIAAAYTAFANRGVRVTPVTTSIVRATNGDVLYKPRAEQRRVLDPRVAYLVTNMMEDVLWSGTGAGVRSRGFTLPAAGKTGTSRDGWFAGFTSELLCVVWVGFDDGRDLNLEGAKSALPIWTEFMKRAASIRQYGQAKPFPAPAGIITREICEDSGQIATERCPNTRNEVFIEGTEPAVECPLHGGDGARPERPILQPTAADSTAQ
jgi:penicillin-binding protein 1B